MKDKYQIWAHLLSIPYSITAAKKITKWLAKKDILCLDWIDVTSNKHDGYPTHTMTDFVNWLKDDSPAVARYDNLASQIKDRVEYEERRFRSSLSPKIKKLYEMGKLNIEIPF